MPKPWAKIEIGYLDHPKFLALNANAICLWHEAKAYCDKYHTDGLIPRHAIKTFRFRGARSVQKLTTSCGPRADGETLYAALWEPHAIGFKMHDYLEHNDCREEVLDRISNAEMKRDRDRRRMQLWRSKKLIALIRARDGDFCRYCHRQVDWADRRGANGATYDHLDPDGENTLENLVVACRGCNSVKGAKPLAVAGMTLLPPKLLLTAGSTARGRSVAETSPESRAETESASVPATTTPPNGGERSAPPRPMAPIHDRSHRNHAHCGRVCLHASLFGEFVRRRNHDAADLEIRDWAMDVEREWGPGGQKGDIEPGDPFDFWKARYSERWPAASSGPKSKWADWKPEEAAS